MNGANDLPLQNEAIIPSDYVLDLNRSVGVPRGMELPSPWDLPSRLFHFPIWAGERSEEGTRQFGLRHPLLADHPFVQRVEKELGVALASVASPALETHHAAWWHAVDLVSSGHWRELLETRRFTTPEHIMDAVTYGLDYSPHESERRSGHISTREARAIMAAMGVVQPIYPRSIFQELATPSSCRTEKGKERWPVNNARGGSSESRAWSRILGIEAGWLRHDAAGFLQWTVQGRSAFAAGDAVTASDPKTGQGMFLF